jgi:hypothetical protein
VRGIEPLAGLDAHELDRTAVVRIKADVLFEREPSLADKAEGRPRLIIATLRQGKLVLVHDRPEPLAEYEAVVLVRVEPEWSAHGQPASCDGAQHRTGLNNGPRTNGTASPFQARSIVLSNDDRSFGRHRFSCGCAPSGSCGYR